MNRHAEFAITTLLAVWGLTPGLSVADSDFRARDKPAQILVRIEKQGAAEVVEELRRRQSAWNGVMTDVSSGQRDWIRVAIALRKGADAGARSELGDAMFRALGSNPQYVLKFAEPEFPLTILCGGRSDPLPTYDQAIVEIKKTAEAVRAVKSEELRTQRERCLQKLGESETNTKRFFGVTH